MFEGEKSAKILFISDFLRVQENAEQTVLAGDRKALIINALNRAGIVASDYAFTVMHPRMPRGCKELKSIEPSILAEDLAKLKIIIEESQANILVPLGSLAMEFLTGLESIDKWHCSIIQSKAELGLRKVIPLFHPERVIREYSLVAYLSFGCIRLKEEMHSPEINIVQRKFMLSLDHSFEEIMSYLRDKVLTASELSCDVETGKGIINTVGFAISPTEAIAISTPLHQYKPEEAFQLWNLIKQIWESDIPKIAQNALFEFQMASKYGMRLNNVIFDTMWCMKFLHPELEKGLHNVGRLYTRFPYWKDDHSDWNNVQDWHKHLEYNCKDTTGTFEAYLNQQKALKERKLDSLFNDYVMRFFPVIAEMCSKGLGLDEEKLFTMRADTERDAESFIKRIEEQTQARLGRSVNVRSPKQLKDMFKDLGIKIPLHKGKETTDKKALTKLRKKHPDEPIIPALINLSSLNKLSGSYLNFQYDPDLRIRYTLDGCPTETGRWAGYNDPFGNGFNPQTVPSKVRNIVIAEPGRVLLEIDLEQAESRYVAYESPEPRLIEMLENREDVHKYVAGKIFNKLPEMVNYAERQLGKKSGHSANYGVGPNTFADACLVELGMVLTQQEAKRIIDGYFEVFPGVRRRQANIQQQIRRTRILKTPIGRERTFYGYMGDALFREAYAYAPQSTIPDITNHLMLFLYDHFLEVDFLLQVHDSLLLSVPKHLVNEVVAAAKDLQAWHPEIHLPGGKLVIPVAAKAGYRWGSLETI